MNSLSIYAGQVAFAHLLATQARNTMRFSKTRYRRRRWSLVKLFEALRPVELG